MMSENRDRGANKRTWTIVLKLKGVAGLPGISLFDFCVLDIPFAWEP